MNQNTPKSPRPPIPKSAKTQEEKKIFNLNSPKAKTKIVKNSDNSNPQSEEEIVREVYVDITQKVDPRIRRLANDLINGKKVSEVDPNDYESLAVPLTIIRKKAYLYNNNKTINRVDYIMNKLKLPLVRLHRVPGTQPFIAEQNRLPKLTKKEFEMLNSIIDDILDGKQIITIEAKIIPKFRIALKLRLNQAKNKNDYMTGEKLNAALEELKQISLGVPYAAPKPKPRQAVIKQLIDEYLQTLKRLRMTESRFRVEYFEFNQDKQASRQNSRSPSRQNSRPQSRQSFNISSRQNSRPQSRQSFNISSRQNSRPQSRQSFNISSTQNSRPQSRQSGNGLRSSSRLTSQSYRDSLPQSPSRNVSFSPSKKLQDLRRRADFAMKWGKTDEMIALRKEADFLEAQERQQFYNNDPIPPYETQTNIKKGNQIFSRSTSNFGVNANSTQNVDDSWDKREKEIKEKFMKKITGMRKRIKEMKDLFAQYGMDPPDDPYSNNNDDYDDSFLESDLDNLELSAEIPIELEDSENHDFTLEEKEREEMERLEQEERERLERERLEQLERERMEQERLERERIERERLEQIEKEKREEKERKRIEKERKREEKKRKKMMKEKKRLEKELEKERLQKEKERLEREERERRRRQEEEDLMEFASGDEDFLLLGSSADDAEYSDGFSESDNEVHRIYFHVNQPGKNK